MTKENPYIFHCPLKFYYENNCYKTHLTLASFNDNLKDEYLAYLSEKEIKRYNNYKYQSRKKSFLLGRTTAKLAIKELCHKDPNSYSIESGIFSYPIVEGLSEKIQVSISHKNNLYASMAHYEHFPVGIDIEKIHPKNINVIMNILTPDEKKLVEKDDVNAFLLWTAKESLGKVLRTGITIPLNLMEIKSIEKKGEIYHIRFSKFGLYKSLSFKLGKKLISISYPSVSIPEKLDLNKIEGFSKNSIFI